MVQDNRNNTIFAKVVTHTNRYQVGLTLSCLYPAKEGGCACGCGNTLPNRKRKKWFSDECRNSAYLNFAVVKGDNSIIRRLVFDRDGGACKSCGLISETWQADHIKPVYKGGGACDLSNFQTLCVDCHKDKHQTLSHHIAISSHAVSMYFSRSLYALGHSAIVSLNTSKEIQILGLAASSPFNKYSSTY